MSTLLFYNRDTGSGAIGTLTPHGFTTAKEFASGSFSQWTHLAASGATLLFYNQQTGAGAFGALTVSGFTTELALGPGSFGTWTHLVATAAGWLFYNRLTGAAAIGRFMTVGFLKYFMTTVALPEGSLAEWTHLVVDGATVLFYNRLNASGAIAQVTPTGLTTTISFAPGSFGVWTHLVNHGSTVLFYNRDTGSGAIGTLTPTGLTTQVSFPVGAFGVWTHVSGDGGTLLFYNRDTGAAAIGLLGPNSFTTTHSYGAGQFSRWSHVSGESACGPEAQELRVAVLLCHWHRPPGVTTVLPPDFYRQYVFNMGAPDGLGRFWFDQSGGQLRLTGQVHDWIPLSKAPTDPSLNAQRQALAAQAITDAQAAGWRAGNAQAILVIVATLGAQGVDAGACGQPIAVEGVDRQVAVLHGDAANWIASSGGNVLGSNFRFDFNCHEVGHLIGRFYSFSHAFGPNGVYDHPYCIMAAKTYGGLPAIYDLWQPGSSRSPEEQTKGPGLSGATRAACGWARVQRFSAADVQQGRELYVAHGGNHTSTLPQVIEYATQVNGVATTYTLEFRSPSTEWDRAYRPALVLCQREGSKWAGNPTWGPRSSTYVSRAVLPVAGALPSLVQPGVLKADVLELGGEWVRLRLTTG